MAASMIFQLMFTKASLIALPVGVMAITQADEKILTKVGSMHSLRRLRSGQIISS
jgi:hypothetical protein